MKNFLLAFALFFWPQCRIGRRQYAGEIGLLCFLALGGWTVMMEIADSSSVSDETVIWLGTYLIPVVVNLLILSALAATARRLHDLGHSGAWAFLLTVPGVNILLILYALVCPGLKGATGWAKRENLKDWR